MGAAADAGGTRGSSAPGFPDRLEARAPRQQPSAPRIYSPPAPTTSSMENHEPPPPRSYVAEVLNNLWTAFGALIRGSVRTADDSARRVAPAPGAAPPLIVDREGRPAPHGAPPAAAPAPAGGDGAPLVAPHPPHGALAGLAEGLERALLPPAAAGGGGGKGALALAVVHDELQAERLEAADPFRKQIASA
ncbi:MAG: hypothetical protein J3K34DRAFT_459640 [Monoraphidium minutum]|nr:MAG: hypothetical protein J3K34DRAFT_459640 [Monoraphidium minutum]